MKLKIIISMLLLIALTVSAQNEKQSDDGYIIDQPGTITFTSGVKIRGKVEKPQVVIFMSKEKSVARSMKFDHSFENDILKPISFKPLQGNFEGNEK